MSGHIPKLEDNNSCGVAMDDTLFRSESDASWWDEASHVADTMEKRMELSPGHELSPSIESAVPPPNSTLMELPSPSFESAPPLSSTLMESLVPSIELVAPLGSTLACESPFTNPGIHTSTITNFSGARDIVPIISLGPKTDAILDRLGLEDRVILNLRDLVGNVRSSKWSAALTSPEWGLSSDTAGDLCNALMEDLATIDKAVSLRFSPLFPYAYVFKLTETET